MFLPHSRDFLKNLGDFTKFYLTSLIVPPYRAPDQRGDFLSHQASKGKVNFQELGLENVQEGEDDFRKSSRKLLFYMDYLLITDFQKFFVYNEFPLKLCNFFLFCCTFPFLRFYIHQTYYAIIHQRTVFMFLHFKICGVLTVWTR